MPYNSDRLGPSKRPKGVAGMPGHSAKTARGRRMMRKAGTLPGVRSMDGPPLDSERGKTKDDLDEDDC